MRNVASAISPITTMTILPSRDPGRPALRPAMAQKMAPETTPKPSPSHGKKRRGLKQAPKYKTNQRTRNRIGPPHAPTAPLTQQNCQRCGACCKPHDHESNQQSEARTTAAGIVARARLGHAQGSINNNSGDQRGSQIGNNYQSDTGQRGHQAWASSAIRSFARIFCDSLFNWPQAAMMSRPRGVRTGEA